ncbi:DUF4352 domain-containing protein [Salipaludibacillus daqingensis]|uniref:DUF4352 domain-containing protein n=1 Tax=Salipaludibacillus daqingensis TaxID=3041001 RepID=UPI00247643DA|nr:DUF4352 domain-containing protein [Salipaludibacillus daqingensis]
MNKIINLTVVTFALITIVACGNENNNEQVENEGEVNSEVDEANEINSNNNEINEVNNQETNDGNSEENESANNYDDQSLQIGETGQVSSNTGEYEITINTVEIRDDIEGEASQLDYFIVANVTVNNIGSNPIQAEDPIGTLELKRNLDGSGFSDLSSHYSEIDKIEGEIEPGEEVTGEMVFQAHDEEEQHIVIRDGLVASGAVNNQVIWSFEKTEAE